MLTYSISATETLLFDMSDCVRNADLFLFLRLRELAARV